MLEKKEEGNKVKNVKGKYKKKEENEDNNE